MRGATSGGTFWVSSTGGFNPRAPCGARPTLTVCSAPSLSVFQSTRPVRGATSEKSLGPAPETSFNPRAPCGARRKSFHVSAVMTGFQSTRPVRGATEILPCLSCDDRVSIHAPRAGRDISGSDLRTRTRGFNPRAPCGARLGLYIIKYLRRWFQSTRPVRGATTRKLTMVADLPGFNPRAPCGARQNLPTLYEREAWFQSTRPVRGATEKYHGFLSRPSRFQSTRPVRGATHTPLPSDEQNIVSIHAPRAGRDQEHHHQYGYDILFQSTRPVRGATFH